MGRAGIMTLATELFEALRAAAWDGEGITRDSYGVDETAALDIVEDAARAHDLETTRDAAANLVVTLEGLEPDLPAVACGSHLDSVPRGGNFDGAAGVIAGLAALVRMRADGVVPRRTIRVYGLRGEESAAFGRAYIGSSALFGMLTPADLDLRHAVTGETLRERMRLVGADVERIERGEVLLPPASLAAWLELHIEQGPVLVAREMPVAVVTGIRGNVRHRAIECIGEAGHSGAVPRSLRHDTVFAVAELLTLLDHAWQSFLTAGSDLVVTAGVLGTEPAEHAIARIPGRMHFSFEARSEFASDAGSVLRVVPGGVPAGGGGTRGAVCAGAGVAHGAGGDGCGVGGTAARPGGAAGVAGPADGERRGARCGGVRQCGGTERNDICTE